MSSDLREPWLVAAWPGMGRVGHVAASYLIEVLGAEALAEIPSEPYFELQAIELKQGLVQERELPKSVFHGWKNPGGRPDLVIFTGDLQPAQHGYRFCEELLGIALELGVSRVFTFAAIGTPMLPGSRPRVLAGATSKALLREARENDIEVLEDGHIRGLNGVLLEAARSKGMGGICLLGEFPYFASTISNPRAASAILRVFTRMAGIEVDLAPLDVQAEQVDRTLVELLEQLKSQSFDPSLGAAERGEPGEHPDYPTKAEEELDPESAARIEELFRRAAEDRSEALALKAELDRLGVFKRYEDRFLDLFKNAE